MKKFLAAFTTALLAVGIAVVGVSAPATATPGGPSTANQIITSTCTDLSVNLSGYADTVPAKPAQGFTEYEWSQLIAPAVNQNQVLWTKADSEVWVGTFDFGKQLSLAFQGYKKADPTQTRTVEISPAQYATYWSAFKLFPTWTATGNSRFHETVPAQDAKTNSVVVSIDSHEVANTTFGTSYAPAAFAYPADFQTHHYSVQVTAWNGHGDVNQVNVASGACSTAPVASLDHVGTCYGNNGFSSENVYVKLDNTNSQLPVTFTGNGINATVAAGATQVAEASPMWDRGGSFDVTAAGKSFPIVIAPFTDCGASTDPQVQGPWVGTCQLPATTRTIEFWFDNTGGNRDVTYIVGSRSIVAPAGQKVHFDADPAPMGGATYVITAGSKSWSLDVPASDCLTQVAPVAPTATAPTVCGTYATLVPATTTGVKYTTVFDETTGKYKVTATPEYGYKFAGTTADQTVVYKGNAGKMFLCIVGANPHSNIIPTCGAADVWLSNDLLTGATTKNKTYTAKIYVDGVLRDKVNVKSGVVTSKSYTFGEDSLFNGSTTHTITVTVNGHQIADNTVESDCLPNVAAANPHSNIIVATCGVADVYISNDFTAGHNNVGTGFDADIYVDGVLTDTVFVAASSSGAYTTNSYPFAEDSTFNGSTIHTITVSALGHQVADKTVQSDCALNVAAANPHSNIVTTVCGTGDVYISNDFVAGYNNTGTDFDADIYVDNVLKDTVTVVASSNGAFTTNDYSFAEDSGDHVIQVKVGGVLVMEKTVLSDCVANPTLTSTTPTLAARTFVATPPAPATAPAESLTTLALLPADATATDQVCTSNGKKTSGYITVALLPEDTTAVQYSVNGTELASAKTEMKPGSYTVTASARDSNESVATSSWNLTIASADCATALATLSTQTTAGDGAGFPIWALLLVFFLLLLLAGILFFLIMRRRRNQADAN